MNLVILIFILWSIVGFILFTDMIGSTNRPFHKWGFLERACKISLCGPIVWCCLIIFYCAALVIGTFKRGDDDVE